MNKMPIFISYATKGTVYEQIMKQHLEPSLKKFNLEHIIEYVPNLGNWYKNTAYKPKFIMEMMEKHNLDKCIFTDADSEIKKYPSLFEQIPDDYDLACHYLSWNLWYGHKNNVMELLTGSMYFKYNNKIKSLCEEWHKQSNEKMQWEQKILQSILRGKSDIKIYHLPLEYAMMISRPRNQPPLVDISGAVILHYQISRKFRRRLR